MRRRAIGSNLAYYRGGIHARRPAHSSRAHDHVDAESAAVAATAAVAASREKRETTHDQSVPTQGETARP